MTITHYESSHGPIALADMAFTHLGNAVRKLERGPIDTDVAAMIGAIKAEIARRGPAPALPRGGDDRPLQPTDNKAPEVDERAEFKARLEGSDAAAAILARVALLELAASALPKADAITSDEDVAKLDAWVREAAQLGRDIEAFHRTAKAPYLLRGQVIDEFKRDIGGALEVRSKAVESRKRPYLLAKAAREAAEREALASLQRKAAAEQRQREEEARAAAAEAQRLADEAAEKLRAAEAERSAREESALAQDEDAPDMRAAEDAERDVDAAEQALRTAQVAASQHEAEATEAALAAGNAEALGDALEGSAGILAKSGLKAVWKHRITGPRAFLASLGPLGPYLKDADVEDTLKRAAKAEPRPDVAGVEFFEDYDVTTNTRARR